MIAAFKRCSNRVAALLCALPVVWAVPAWAHKSSDAYLQLSAAPPGVELRIDVALRDLDVVVDIDADGDGRVTWRETKASWDAIEGYVLPRVALDGCTLRTGTRALERRSDGAYAALRLASDCAMPAAPKLRYALFADVDPTHRGILRLQRADGSVGVQLLEPRHTPAGESASASAGEAEPAQAGSFFARGHSPHRHRL